MTAQIARKADKLNWHMQQTNSGQVVAFGKPTKGEESGYYLDIKVGKTTLQKRFNSARALHTYINQKLAFYKQQLYKE